MHSPFALDMTPTAHKENAFLVEAQPAARALPASLAARLSPCKKSPAELASDLAGPGPPLEQRIRMSRRA